jgi:hypothetical protein
MSQLARLGERNGIDGSETHIPLSVHELIPEQPAPPARSGDLEVEPVAVEVSSRLPQPINRQFRQSSHALPARSNQSGRVNRRNRPLIRPLFVMRIVAEGGGRLQKRFAIRGLCPQTISEAGGNQRKIKIGFPRPGGSVFAAMLLTLPRMSLPPSLFHALEATMAACGDSCFAISRLPALVTRPSRVAFGASARLLDGEIIRACSRSGRTEMARSRRAQACPLRGAVPQRALEALLQRTAISRLLARGCPHERAMGRDRSFAGGGRRASAIQLGRSPRLNIATGLRRRLVRWLGASLPLLAHRRRHSLSSELASMRNSDR